MDARASSGIIDSTGAVVLHGTLYLPDLDTVVVEQRLGREFQP
jgi:hypothetical protein